MSWYGVIKEKFGNRYWAGQRKNGKPRWVEDRADAKPFFSRDVAKETASGIFSRTVLVRLRRPSERRRDKYEAQVAERKAKEEAERTIRDDERARIASWLECWARLNEPLLKNPGFANRRDFVRGMLCVLHQAAPRIRARDLRADWAWDV